MKQRIRVLFAASALFFMSLCICKICAASEDDDKKAAIDVVLAHEMACQTYDLDKVDFLHLPDARGMEESYPGPIEPGMRESYGALKDAGVHIDYHPQDAVATVHGDVAWVTVTLRSVWTADKAAGRAMIGGEWHATFVESFVLVRTPGGWKIALGHSSRLPAEFGFAPDYQAAEGGMKLEKVAANGPADKAGLKSGDVLIDCGGHKIDNYIDYARLSYYYSEGETVPVTVMRGQEKITKEVTLEAMK
jgi:hypothetical protein